MLPESEVKGSNYNHTIIIKTLICTNTEEQDKII